MNISIIIPTRNRSSLLERTLASMSKQTISEESFEVIIVDNGSSDNTKDISLSFGGEFANFQYIYEREPGLHVGRHAGLKAAKGEILIYADDDIEALPTWIEAINDSFRDPQVALVGGNNFPKYESKPPEWVNDLWRTTPWGKVNAIYSILDFGKECKEIPANYVWGCNFAILKSVLLEEGGFHPDAMPDGLLKYRGDGEAAVWQAVSKKGYKTQFNPKASVNHLVSTSRMRIEYLYRRGYIQGISSSYAHTRKNKKINIISDGIYRKNMLFKNKLRKMLKSTPKILDAYLKGHEDGYAYHQNELKIDAALIDWVLKDNYLE